MKDFKIQSIFWIVIADWANKHKSRQSLNHLEVGVRIGPTEKKWTNQVMLGLQKLIVDAAMLSTSKQVDWELCKHLLTSSSVIWLKSKM